MPISTIGITGDPVVLFGHVKLKAGAGVTLTRVDADNAIEIEAAAMPDRAVKVYLTAYEPLPKLATTVIPWDAAEWDNASFWSPASPTHLTIPEDGHYLIIAKLSVTPNATGYRTLEISLNDAQVVAKTQGLPSGSIATDYWVTAELILHARDYLTMDSYNTASANINASFGPTATALFIRQLTSTV
jgi:hypothetical protein